MFTRYNDPVAFLQMSIDNKRLYKSYISLANQVNEEKMWQLYLHIAPYYDGNYNKFKDEINNKPKPGLTKKEANEIYKMSEDILRQFEINDSKEAVNNESDI